MRHLRFVGLILVPVAALLLARLIASGPNSPFYTRCSALGTLVPAIARSAGCHLNIGSVGGSGMAVPVWVHSNSDVSYIVSATPEVMADVVQKLKAEFEQAAAATNAKVSTESEKKHEAGGLVSFTLAYKTRTTHGSIIVNTRPGNQGADAKGRRQYQLDVAINERGW